MRRLLSVTICLVAIAWSLPESKAHECEVQFLVTAPKVLLAGTTEKVCVDLLNDASIDFTLTLEESGFYYREPNPDPEIFTEALYSMSTSRQCFDFEIPVLSAFRQSAKLIFQAKDLNNETAGFICNSTKDVLISGLSVDTLIQTDKPIYKPGQTVKFRMMSVDKNFKPDNSTVSLIWIESPNAIRLAQWEDVQPNQGLVDLEFPMSSEPLLGDWTIKADFGDREAEQTFEVAEYVLPKFEITVEATPSYILMTDTSLGIKICAKYTYGQPVRGEIVVQSEVQSYRNARPVGINTGETGRDGCYSFDLDLTQFDLRSTSYSFGRSLNMDISVTDSVTGETLTHSAKAASIHWDALTIRVSTPGSFKPGVPFYGKITVNRPDETPAAGEFITFSVQAKTLGSWRYSDIYAENFTTPDSGEIEFNIPDLSLNTTGLSLLAKAPGYEQAPDEDRSTYRVWDPVGSASLSAQFSPSGSFIQVEPIRDTLAIGSTQTLNVYFTSDDPDAEQDTDIQFVFMSLGDVLDVPVSVPAARKRRQVNGDERANEEPECEGDLVYTSCGTACPLICGEPRSEICTLQCIIGCVCPDSLYRDSFNGTQCTTADNCTITIETVEPEIIDYIYPPIYPESSETDIEVAEPLQLRSVRRSFQVTQDMTPAISLLVYFIRPDGEVVADSVFFEVEKSFANQVNLEFADKQVEPNSNTSLEVTADAQSLCGVGVVDKSVYVLGGENALTKDNLFDSIRRYQLDRYGIFYDSSSSCPSGRWPYYRRRKRTSVPYYGGGSSNFDDSSEAFKDIGLVYLTNLDVETKPCKRYPNIAYNRRVGVQGPIPVADNIVYDSPVEREDVQAGGGADSAPLVRNYFPETFLWQLVTTDDSGSASIPIQAPHTITEWIGNAFCLSPENGVGVAPTASLTTFQPFFLTFSLPYSVIRGENVPITVSVFNYLDACLVVRVTLADSEDFDLLSDSDAQEVCVCGGAGESVEFRIVPGTLGKIPLEVSGMSVIDSATLCGNEILSDQMGAQDAVRRELLVEAEGVPQDFSFSEYFCPKDYPHEYYTGRAAITLPSNAVVEGSQTGKIIVTGDMLGPSMENLGHLIRLPTGCGEQNMLGFVPNIVALEYLTATNQLTPDVEATLKRNMMVGYQRELNYRHRDGSYSAFGESATSGPYNPGNTWLTAFVVRSLAQAKSYIFVDEADLNISIAWLKELQDPETGCIQSVGYLGYKAMMGGVSGESMLTAYAVVTYLEAGVSPDDDAVVRGLECVMADLDSVEDNYALSQMAYVLALAGRTEELTDVLDRLDATAQTESGLRYWTSNRPAPARSTSYYYYGASADSITIEINSYVMLTEFVRAPSTASQKTSGTARWLIKNRSVQGGFGSTQDTIMGLTALAKFAASGDSVTDLYVESKHIAGSSRVIQRYFLTDNNRITQQELHFTPGQVPQFVFFRSLGTGCALVQVVVTYNVEPTPDPQASFTLKSTPDEVISKKGRCYDYRITNTVSYTGSDGESNMALVTVVPPSGFYPVKSSLRELLDSNPAVKRYDIDGNKINFYFDSLDETLQTFSFDVTKEFDIEDAKPGYVTVTDYYEESLSKSISLDLECDLNAVPIDRDPEVFIEIDILPEDDLVPEVDIAPPPPPMIIPRPSEGEGDIRDPGQQPDGGQEIATAAPEAGQDTDVVTPFAGFGRQPSGKEEDAEVDKPVEVIDDKPSSSGKQEESTKDGEEPDQGAQEGAVDEGRKEGDGDGEGPADKPGKLETTEGTPEEQKVEAQEPEKPDTSRSSEESSEKVEAATGTEATETVTEIEVTEIIYEEVTGAPAELVVEGTERVAAEGTVVVEMGTETVTEIVEVEGTAVAYRFAVGTPLYIEHEGGEEEEEAMATEIVTVETTTGAEVAELVRTTAERVTAAPEPEGGEEEEAMATEIVTMEATSGAEVAKLVRTTAERVTAAPEPEGTTAEQDFDECTVENICPGVGYKCVNFPGTYECQCADGYTMDTEGNCHSCAYCGETMPEDGMERFCSSDFVYVVKRRRNDLRLLREKRYTDALVENREYRNFNVADEFCQCETLEFKAVDRFIVFAKESETDVLPFDNTATILPFLGNIVNDLDRWRSECP